ncbi:ornithine carbamoyltransferase [Puccinia graminis f. sp. tritici]|uniref:ornithine carbamoyltransferase n=2 Tax=Puccinia graminis f. sp. tritici TaxID=56615 RepID=E3KPE6_PUCGT|nr:ornithine carbamoyltransferase [Puccinia graminis f. sp. tritici CRL 75-36-700-3]EFP86171.1 ornithine carbamoyltransferase [Puccinia graminis f. sp. tritici CRL 75-36-700-3]KAA1064166.1 ornithine carbamoyltransferase [Puccinia graminis f. sp. tritici]KAA1092765.1 ornithine carbamoyltransferase [Puccinia graminis f. sp. tritici]
MATTLITGNTTRLAWRTGRTQLNQLLNRTNKRFYRTTEPKPPHLLTLADLSIREIQSLVSTAINIKKQFKDAGPPNGENLPVKIEQILQGKTIALIFGKRSTRTRVASETATALLGGHPMFLSPSDIQLGVNESLYDTSKVVSSMVDGIMARVGDHSEVELLAKNSSVPVINALSSLYHPTQILADLVTLLESFFPHSRFLSSLNGLNVTWIGDANNILNDMIVTYPRLGINLKIATPQGYSLDQRVLDRMELGLQDQKNLLPDGKLVHVHDPLAAVQDADVIVTDTWISMGQESEMQKRLQDFNGFQITEELCKKGKAKADWKFMHCLPRHQEEVDDQVFYGPRSLVFPEAENRKWTILSVFQSYFGNWKIKS